MAEEYTKALESVRKMTLAVSAILQNMAEEQETAPAIAEFLGQVEYLHGYFERAELEAAPPGEDLGLGCLSIEKSLRSAGFLPAE